MTIAPKDNFTQFIVHFIRENATDVANAIEAGLSSEYVDQFTGKNKAEIYEAILAMSYIVDDCPTFSEDVQEAILHAASYLADSTAFSKATSAIAAYNMLAAYLNGGAMKTVIAKIDQNLKTAPAFRVDALSVAIGGILGAYVAQKN